MLKKILFLLILILAIYWLNWAFFDAIVWKMAYDKWEYDKAITWFSSSLKKPFWLYNEWNIYYKNEKFDDAIKSYTKVIDESKDKDLLFRTYHNLWNSYYRLWEEKLSLEQNTDEGIPLEVLQDYEKSVSNFDLALEIKFDEETKANRDFVKEKLWTSDLDNSWNWKSDQASEWENSTSQWNNSASEWNNSGESSDEAWSENWDESSTNWTTSESGSLTNSNWENSSWDELNWNNLTEEEKQAIEEYVKTLQDMQEAYTEWFNKVPQSNNFYDDFFNFDIFGDPFFDNSLLNSNDSKKDW
jgi:tetratricopeptide (TPR) repeat protein